MTEAWLIHIQTAKYNQFSIQHMKSGNDDDLTEKTKKTKTDDGVCRKMRKYSKRRF